MAGTRLKALAIFSLLALVAHSVDATYGQGGNYTGGGLKFNYYQKLCPNAENLVNTAVQTAFNNDSTIIGGLIRMFFHDCFVEGCDGSVLIDSIPGSSVLAEKDGPPNANSLRGFEVIDAAKLAVEAACPGVVSCADIVSYAARDSIVFGGGNIPFGLWLGGRKDGSISLASETLTNLPAPFLNYSQLVTAFSNKGLTPAEMVTLSSAHTVGHAHCGTILSRLYNFQGTGQADPSIASSYLPTLQAACPSNAPSTLINMDMRTPTKVDTNYIQDVLNGRGLFESDNALRTNSAGVATLRLLDNQFIFSPAFSLAVLKMGTIQVKTGSAGNIRLNCRVLN